jgi:hypothetical protein
VSAVSYLTNREKLRLDLYERRFSIYELADGLYQQLRAWNDDEGVTGQLSEAASNFRIASVEGHFLFSKESGVPAALQEITDDAFYIINWTMRLKASTAAVEPDDLKNRTARFMNALTPLRTKMGPFLNFHSYSALPCLFDDGESTWP